MKKEFVKMLTVVSMAIVLVIAAALSVSAAPTQIGSSYIYYEVSGGTTVTFTGTGTIPSDVRDTIGEWTWYAIEKVVIADTITGIGDEAFNGCSNLEYVTIGNGVITIGEKAFYDSGIMSVTIPKNVTTIGTDAFGVCDNLPAITVDEGNLNYCTVDGVLLSKDKTTLVQYPAGRNGSTYTIPSTVKTIGTYAFDACNKLTSMAIPKGVTTIGNYAFYDCDGLKSVTIPSSVTKVGFGAFDECYDDAGSGLESVTIEQGVTTIDGYAFHKCVSLKSVTIPLSLTTVGECAFENCEGLTDVYVTCTEEEWNSHSHTCTIENEYDFNGSFVTAWWHYQEPVSDDTTDNTAEVIAIVMSKEHTITIDEPENGNVRVSAKTAVFRDKVTVTVTPDENYKTESVMAVTKNGRAVKLTKVNENKYTFTVGTADITVSATFAYDGPRFVDVPKVNEYYESVEWAVVNDVTTGTDETHFSPYDITTRAEMITFLWNMCGNPEATITELPFTDIDIDGFYYEALLWGYEHEYVKGTSATTFSPDETITRGQAVAFLGRLSDILDNDESEGVFYENASDNYYNNAINWSIDSEIANVTTVDEFAPDTDCVRGEVVNYLYRFDMMK